MLCICTSSHETPPISLLIYQKSERTCLKETGSGLGGLDSIYFQGKSNFQLEDMVVPSCCGIECILQTVTIKDYQGRCGMWTSTVSVVCLTGH